MERVFNGDCVSVKERRKIKGWRNWLPLRRLRHRLEYGLLCVVAWSIPRCPRRIALAIAHSIGWLGYHGDRRGRRLGAANLRLAVEHGQLDLHGRSIEQTLRLCYRNFARGFIDLFWFSRLTPEQLERWVDIEFSDNVRQWIQSNQGGIFLTPHFGIFEWTSLVVGWQGVRLDIVAQDFHNPVLTEVFARARRHSGHRIVSRKGAMLKLVRTIRSGGSIAMLPDLNIPRQGAAVPVDVFGIPAWMPATHAEISLRFNVPMLLAVCEPHPDGRATLRALDLIGHHSDNRQNRNGGLNPSRNELTQLVWDRFESAIRERPDLWLWMYRHWRHRHESRLHLAACSSDHNDAASPTVPQPRGNERAGGGQAVERGGVGSIGGGQRRAG